MDCVVSPVLHALPVAELEVKNTLPPEQKVVRPAAVKVAVGKGLTVTVVFEDAEQPFPSVTTTL